MSPKAKALAPIFAAAWVCVALFAIYQTNLRGNDAASATASGILFVSSLLFLRYIVGLPSVSGPIVYLLVLGIFHLGLTVPWALGIYDISRTPAFIPYGLSRSIALVDYSISAFSIGIVLALKIIKIQREIATENESDHENPEVYVAGCLLLAVGITMFVVGLIGLDPLGYFRLTYSETFRLRAESDPRLFGSGITIAFIGLSIAAAGASSRRFRTISAVGAIWLISLLYLGFRGPTVVAALIVYIIARKKGLRVPRFVPILAAAVLLVILPALHSGRELPLNDRLSQVSLKDFNLLDAPAEMGMSIRPLIETIDLVGPNDFRLGRTYWIAIKGIVPNLALRWEASSTTSDTDLPPSYWITALVDPWAYKNYGGMGFSAIAEPYMNFGVPGVLIYFLLLSFFLIYLEQISIHNSYTLAAWALILGPLLWTTRNDFTNFFRPAVWGLLILSVIKVFSRTYSKIFPKQKHLATPLTSKLVQAKHG